MGRIRIHFKKSFRIHNTGITDADKRVWDGAAVGCCYLLAGPGRRGPPVESVGGRAVQPGPNTGELISKNIII